jgi:hypothetical protein
MKFSPVLGMICATLFVTSCAFVQPRRHAVQAPPERISQRGYSLVSPREKGWLVGERNQYQLVLGKDGGNPDETFIIQAWLFKLAPYKTGEDFLRLLKGRVAENPDQQRFKLIDQGVTAYTEKGTDCAKSHTLLEDHGATKRSGRTAHMILEALALTCAHPKDRSVAVEVVYSHRYYPEHRDPAFLDKATGVLNSIEFTDLSGSLS